MEDHEGECNKVVKLQVFNPLPIKHNKIQQKKKSLNHSWYYLAKSTIKIEWSNQSKLLRRVFDT